MYTTMLKFRISNAAPFKQKASALAAGALVQLPCVQGFVYMVVANNAESNTITVRLFGVVVNGEVQLSEGSGVVLRINGDTLVQRVVFERAWIVFEDVVVNILS